MGILIDAGVLIAAGGGIELALNILFDGVVFIATAVLAIRISPTRGNAAEARSVIALCGSAS
jgi:hypothetical protein